MDMNTELQKISQDLYQCELAHCSIEQAYDVVLTYCKNVLREKPSIAGERRLYYFSAEFLIGKLLSNNLINLGIYEEMRDVLAKHHLELSEIEDIEKEPSLGNGGLGRLAACFLDSIATLGLPGDGVGLNYHLGLFKQVFKDLKQTEQTDEWLTPLSWLNKSEKSYVVSFKDFALKSTLYDIDVIGYHGRKNRLHLFDIDTIDETIVTEGITIDPLDIKKNLTLFLYPDDSSEDGKKLRLYQQYFMVSNGAQMIIEDLKARQIDLRRMHEYVVIQINDTHPSLVIPELIRLLMAEGLTLKESVRTVSVTCAYTNHTILAEALEKWPMTYLADVVPSLLPIIEALDAIAYERSPNKETAIIDANHLVHMAHMDMHFGYSVNGVAAIHTDILKHVELQPFYALYPEKFNNKTNGITFRRWLMSCNKELTQFLDDTIGNRYHQDADELEKLLAYKDDPRVLRQLINIKKTKKKQLCAYVLKHEGIKLDENAVFDVQVKRLHEYKRQQMNVLGIIHQYLAIKKGQLPCCPVTYLFGAKAAPAYHGAKDIIHVILCLQELIKQDPEVSPWLTVVMLENYNVTYAEHLIPAADISEQISLASKEASGTGNMKLMLNGAVTIGTDDGANVEIHERVGDDNIYTFGMDSKTVIAHLKAQDYHPQDLLEDAFVKETVSFLISDELKAIGDAKALTRLYEELTTHDHFMALLDLKDYIAKKSAMLKDYADKEAWAQKMLVNIAEAGFFSSDRTIASYNEDIWHL